MGFIFRKLELLPRPTKIHYEEKRECTSIRQKEFFVLRKTYVRFQFYIPFLCEKLVNRSPTFEHPLDR